MERYRRPKVGPVSSGRIAEDQGLEQVLSCLIFWNVQRSGRAFTEGNNGSTFQIPEFK